LHDILKINKNWSIRKRTKLVGFDRGNSPTWIWINQFI